MDRYLELVERSAGVGRLYRGDVFLGTVRYQLAVYVDVHGTAPVDSAPLCGEHQAHRAARVASRTSQMTGLADLAQEVNAKLLRL